MNALTETEVANAAVVILTDTETHGDLARAVNTLETVKEFNEAGDEVVLIFDGAGTRWIAELSKPDYQSHEEYASHLAEAGLSVELVVRHDAALAGLVSTIRMRLLGAEVTAKMKRLDLPGVDWPAARRMAAAADAAVRDGSLGYAVIVARRPSD